MTDYVLDTSTYVKATTEDHAHELRVRLRWNTVHAPQLILAEVGSAARRMAAAERLSVGRAAAMLESIEGTVDVLHPHPPLVRLAWSLRHNLSFYDALYVSLAAALKVPLLTTDRRLAGAPDLPCAVEVV